MVEPDDFEMDAVRTLAHVTAAAPVSWHGAFWGLWQQRVVAAPARFNEFRGASPDGSDASATHWVESIGHVRIGCRLIEPPRGTPVRGGLVALHGYRCSMPLSGEDEEWSSLASRGLLVAAVRLRGYAGSRMDCGDYTSEEGGWIGRGLAAHVHKPEDALDWCLVQGVADAACVVRAMRAEVERRTGGRGRVMLHGTSLGGGVAVMAAAQLGAAGCGRCRVDRLSIALPSLGDWAWRRRFGDRGAREGAGADVRRTLVAHAQREEAIGATLSLGDAAIHARQVRAPALCMLAARDEVVPAPSAAAVCNALCPDPGERWRFVAPYGHFDGGLRNARRHALFVRCRDDFLDPAMEPRHAMAGWEGLLEQGDRAA